MNLIKFYIVCLFENAFSVLFNFISRKSACRGPRIPDDVLPPRSQSSASSAQTASAASVCQEALKKRGRKRKPFPLPEASTSTSTVVAETRQETSAQLQLEGAKIIVLESGQQVINLTAEEAKQLGIQDLSGNGS